MTTCVKENTYAGRAYNSCNESHAKGHGTHSHLKHMDTTAVQGSNGTESCLATDHEHNCLHTVAKCVCFKCRLQARSLTGPTLNHRMPDSTMISKELPVCRSSTPLTNFTAVRISLLTCISFSVGSMLSDAALSCNTQQHTRHLLCSSM